MILTLTYAALDHIALEEPRDQFINSGQIFGYIGEGKGIQGHQNSSYLDSTIFALFAVSDVFDSMFLEQLQGDPVGEIKNILWKKIVNPLRRYVLHQCQFFFVNDDKLLMSSLKPHFYIFSNGVVRFESIKRLQMKMKELKGGTYEEIGNL